MGDYMMSIENETSVFKCMSILYLVALCINLKEVYIYNSATTQFIFQLYLRYTLMAEKALELPLFLNQGTLPSIANEMQRPFIIWPLCALK